MVIRKKAEAKGQEMRKWQRERGKFRVKRLKQRTCVARGKNNKKGGVKIRAMIVTTRMNEREDRE